MRSRRTKHAFAALLFLGYLGATAGNHATASRKMELIESEQVPRGSEVIFTQEELTDYVRREAMTIAPQGLRDPRLTLSAGRATGFAYIDFPKLRESMGKPMGKLMAWLLAGERPVQVDARIQSGGGQATVAVDRVEVSGVSISGPTLDYLIRNYLWSYFPSAKVGEPFALAHRMERIEVQPGQARVVIAR